MTPLLLIVLGLAALASSSLLIRRLGPRGRIGRILAATPVIPVDEAIRLAQAGVARYVAVGGRVDSEREFTDEADRPLAIRRSRLELHRRVGRGYAWVTVADTRDAVPFSIAGGLASIAVDETALDEGLIVVMRQSEGTAGEIPDHIPDGTPPGTPARFRVELVSTVDHALALGVPAMDPARGPILRPGLGRPLVLTTMEPAEAMRMLADGHRASTRAAAVLIAVGLAACAGGGIWAIAGALQ